MPRARSSITCSARIRCATATSLASAPTARKRCSRACTALTGSGRRRRDTCLGARTSMIPPGIRASPQGATAIRIRTGLRVVGHDLRDGGISVEDRDRAPTPYVSQMLAEVRLQVCDPDLAHDLIMVMSRFESWAGHHACDPRASAYPITREKWRGRAML